jgi:hypothetical protein
MDPVVPVQPVFERHEAGGEDAVVIGQQKIHGRTIGQPGGGVNPGTAGPG